jgi:ABC-type transport system substrate-binding protein/TolA-binding protein
MRKHRVRLKPEAQAREVKPQSQAKRRSRLLSLALRASILCCLLAAAPAWAAERLFEQEPFDRITLDEQNRGTVLRVRPLDLPGRQVPAKPPPTERLPVRLVEQPDRTFEVFWGSIKKVELFEQMVLDEATALVADGKADEAYDYFRFLDAEYPKLPGLAKARDDYLCEEARLGHRRQQYDAALAILREVHRRNPQRPGLDKAMGLTTGKLVEQYVAADDYTAARALLRNLAACYADHPLAAQWEEKLKTQAAALLTEARAAQQAGDLRTAAQRTRKLVLISPAVEGARELAENLHRQYPRVVVGVRDKGTVPGNRLLYRTLTEFAGPSESGGKYVCTVGELTIDNAKRRLSLEVKPGLRWASGSATLTGYDVAQRLLAAADPADAAYRPDWAELFQAVAVQDVYRMEVELRQTHLRPQALLQTMLPPGSSPVGQVANLPSPVGQVANLSEQQVGNLLHAQVGNLPHGGTNGPYFVAERDERETTYLANPRYFAATPAQPKELVERQLADAAVALRALRRGDVQALERVEPWELAAFRGDKNIIVGSYALPPVHCLIPNLRKPLTAERDFRKALVHGIHREAILRELLAGATVPGAAVLSGPFPCGRSPQDPIAYACDPKIKPRAYDPRLAIVLAAVTKGTVPDKSGTVPVFAGTMRSMVTKTGLSPSESTEDPKGTVPFSPGRKLGQSPLVLAHPPDETARRACVAIRRHLALAGIPVALKELSIDPWSPMPAEIDLLYAELPMWEPLTDARRLLAADGPAGACNPAMAAELKHLAGAADWKAACAVLRRIHRLAHEDAAVIPLWQLPEHFAHQARLQGVGAAPLTLYQNVERWQLGFQYPDEK